MDNSIWAVFHIYECRVHCLNPRSHWPGFQPRCALFWTQRPTISALNLDKPCLTGHITRVSTVKPRSHCPGASWQFGPVDPGPTRDDLSNKSSAFIYCWQRYGLDPLWGKNGSRSVPVKLRFIIPSVGPVTLR